MILIIDNARYHHARLYRSWREAQVPDFALFFLPPYSPGLNPIEGVWKLVRRRCLHNHYFSTLELVMKAVEERFTEWANGSKALRELALDSSSGYSRKLFRIELESAKSG